MLAARRHGRAAAHPGRARARARPRSSSIASRTCSKAHDVAPVATSWRSPSPTRPRASCASASKSWSDRTRRRSLAVGTFHANCARWLRRDIKHLGCDPGFAIYDDNDQVDLVKQILKELETWTRSATRRAPCSARSRTPRASWSVPSSTPATPGLLGGDRRARLPPLRRAAGAQPRARLRRSAARDGAALPRSPRSARASTRTASSTSWSTSSRTPTSRSTRSSNCSRASSRNMCVVGDEDQSIYSWRSADIRNILNFENDYPDLKVVVLEQNYRSTSTILKVARAVIASNKQRKEKNLWTENDEGTPVTVHEAYNEQDEALYVVREIERHAPLARVPLNRFGVLYRTNAQSRAIEDAFVAAACRTDWSAACASTSASEVKDVLAYLRLIHNPFDAVSLQRVINLPPRGIGQKTVAGAASAGRRALGMSAVRGAGARRRRCAHDDVRRCWPHRSPFGVRGARAVRRVRRHRRAASRRSGDTQSVLELLDTILETHRLRALPAGRHRGRRGAAGPTSRSCATRRRTTTSWRRRTRWRRSSRTCRWSRTSTSSTRADGERRRDADHAARGQGARVPVRVPGGRRGRRAAAPALDRRPDASSRRSGGCFTSASPARCAGCTWCARSGARCMAVSQVNTPSRFLLDVPPSLAMVTHAPGAGRAASAWSSPREERAAPMTAPAGARNGGARVPPRRRT